MVLSDSVHTRASEGLVLVQRRLEQHVGDRSRQQSGDSDSGVGTLDPRRGRASTLVEVHARALRELPDADQPRASDPLARGLAALAQAQLDAFPANLFWDLDLIACEIVREAVASADPLGVLDDRFARMARLQTLYGRTTAINFSYVHDFVYGFDWVKWIAREPSLQAAPPRPFSLAFLDYMQRRGLELLELIAHDDRKYPRLEGDEPRNPFPFSRDPESELRLHRELARRGLIPVPTWDPDVDVKAIDWARPWQALRVGVAVELWG